MTDVVLFTRIKMPLYIVSGELFLTDFVISKGKNVFWRKDMDSYLSLKKEHQDM